MDTTQPAAVGSAAAWLRRAGPAALSLALFFAALLVLRNELRHVTWFELTHDMAAMPQLRLAAALGLTALNYAVLTG